MHQMALAMDPEVLKHYLADDPPNIVQLKIKPHFDALSDQEKLYAHHISVACYAGTRIVLRQISPESEPIYDFILALHKRFNGDWVVARTAAGISETDMSTFLAFAAQFLGNLGNYKSFGDSKFVPRTAAAALRALATAGGEETAALYERVKDGIFASASASKMHLGYPDAGHVSTYYPDSPDITEADITAVSDFLEGKKLLPENTRLRKVDGGAVFEVLIASAERAPPAEERDLGEETEWTLSEGPLGGSKVKLVYGDYAEQMGTVATEIGKAADAALNETQRAMHQAYAQHFRTGSMKACLQSQRSWIKDKGPAVECNIGFVETYRDPHGIRGEWEGFAAMVNKERTRAFGKLVAVAPDLIPMLPWDESFEKDTFLSPDFTSLEVLTFAGSGIPAGINIPNFDSIRQNLGFKNVSLGNVLSAKGPNEPLPFLKERDIDLYLRCRDPAFEVQVGLHELLGHGCGKLLQETSPGQYNFNIKNPPISPLTGEPVKTWYKPGQTWGSVFGPVAASYEECRAECVAMALSCDFGVLSIFGFGDGTPRDEGPAADILYASYLSMARAGMVAVEFWDPQSGKWGQAHMQARFSILQTFLRAGDGFCTLDYTADDLSDLTINVDKSKIMSHGRPAVEDYLRKLQVYKATADVEAGTKMYEDITAVDDWYKNKVRPAVLAKKAPRKVFVQANTVLGPDGKVELKEYEPTAEGMIKSFAEREYI
ncbi:dipeptidyl peptidase-like protein III [Lineolata rhizophorae]|uniref:Dipeptidyl peptidase 3 n=1 Tax=Lineolata rhizophorae TaxID=578093 RepID=A0A6A6PAG9_9PEZI|nr:dipeptidyl peptidase-like protein III [Lineolata rhizophorae]